MNIINKEQSKHKITRKTFLEVEESFRDLEKRETDLNKHFHPWFAGMLRSHYIQPIEINKKVSR